ncbi:hypothetical protein BDR26DRAFT_901127 [Obelidium mucronatum]|nr:hypothetical protein BDR26DRAFT_901127 [Obelidium mucronatum]
MIKTKESTTISAALNAPICTQLHFDNLCHAIHKLTDRTCGPSDKLIFFPAEDIADTVSDNATDYEDSELEVSEEASDYDAMEMCEMGGDSEKSHAVNMAMAEMMETERLGYMNPAEEDSRSSNNFPDLGAEDPPACAAGITSVVPLISSEIQIPSSPLSDVSIYDSDIFEDDDARIAEDDAFSSSCTRDNSREPTPQKDTPPFIHTEELAHIQLINPMSPWSCIAENPPNRHTVLPQWPMFFGQYNYSNSHIPWYPHIPRENFTAVHPSIHSIHKTNLQYVSQQIKREPGYNIAPSNQNSLQRSCIQGIRIELPRVIAPTPKTPSSTTSRPNPYTTPPVEESEKPTEKYSQFECLQCGGNIQRERGAQSAV